MNQATSRSPCSHLNIPVNLNKTVEIMECTGPHYDATSMVYTCAVKIVICDSCKVEVTIKE